MSEVKSAIDLAAEPSDHKPAKGMIHVKIYTPLKEYYHADAKSVTALNESGQFDILPGHHNFITMLLPFDVEVEDADKEKHVIPIQRGLMHVRDDKVTIFLDV